MFNIGTAELFIIVIVALLIVKPGDVPKVARSIGKFLGTIKSYRDTFYKEIDSVKDLGSLDIIESKDKSKKETEETAGKESKETAGKEPEESGDQSEDQSIDQSDNESDKEKTESEMDSARKHLTL